MSRTRMICHGVDSSQPIVFLLSSIAIYISFSPLASFLSVKTPLFKTSQRKKYILKNVVKAGVLSVLLLLSIVTMVFVPSWSSVIYKYLGSIYVSNDFVALWILYHDLKTSTKIHHLVTNVAIIIYWNLDMEEYLEAKLLFFYAFFSLATFYVNLYMGLRLCYKENDLEVLKKICMYGYPLVLMLNWIVQLSQMWSAGGAALWFVIIILLVLYDDLVLVHWCWKKSRQSSTIQVKMNSSSDDNYNDNNTNIIELLQSPPLAEGMLRRR